MWWAISPIRWVFGLGLKVTGISEFTLEYNPLIRGRVAFSERFFLAIIQKKKNYSRRNFDFYIQQLTVNS